MKPEKRKKKKSRQQRLKENKQNATQTSKETLQAAVPKDFHLKPRRDSKDWEVESIHFEIIWKKHEKFGTARKLLLKTVEFVKVEDDDRLCIQLAFGFIHTKIASSDQTLTPQNTAESWS